MSLDIDINVRVPQGIHRRACRKQTGRKWVEPEELHNDRRGGSPWTTEGAPDPSRKRELRTNGFSPLSKNHYPPHYFSDIGPRYAQFNRQARDGTPAQRTYTDTLDSLDSDS
jgi:hypothetical protein